MPILRPLIGMDKLEITDAGPTRSGPTRSPSSRTRTAARSSRRGIPATRIEAEAIAALEARLDLDRLVTQGVEAAVQELFEFPAGAGPYPSRGAARRPVTEPVSE